MQALVAQLRVTLQAIAVFAITIAQRAHAHPDFPFFDTLPGAGAVVAPRLLVAFGAQRDRYASAEDRRLRMGDGGGERPRGTLGGRPRDGRLGRLDGGYSGPDPLGDYLPSNIRDGFTYASSLDASRRISWRMCMRISEFMSRT